MRRTSWPTKRIVSGVLKDKQSFARLTIVWHFRHKSNTLARELDHVLREARSEPLSAAQMDSILEVVGIPDSMRAHQVHAPVIRPLFGSPQNRSQWSALPVDRSNR